ncbi:MAG: hypothetical protein HQL31_06385 [Planctomycetes bacterium]|nr:hypothetical protein [Planctomycetota bacterium]
MKCENSRGGANSRLVTFRRYDDAGLAHLDRLRLENENIFCFLEDEHTVSMAWHLSNAIGGIKLRIREEDVLKAAELLKPGQTLLACPKCGSGDIVLLKMNPLSAIFGLLLAWIPGPSSSRWKCIPCRHHWK